MSFGVILIVMTAHLPAVRTDGSLTAVAQRRHQDRCRCACDGASARSPNYDALRADQAVSSAKQRARIDAEVPLRARASARGSTAPRFASWTSWTGSRVGSSRRRTIPLVTPSRIRLLAEDQNLRERNASECVMVSSVDGRQWRQNAGRRRRATAVAGGPPRRTTLDVAPEHSLRMPGAERLHGCFFRREAARQSESAGTRRRRAVGRLRPR